MEETMENESERRVKESDDRGEVKSQDTNLDDTARTTEKPTPLAVGNGTPEEQSHTQPTAAATSTGRKRTLPDWLCATRAEPKNRPATTRAAKRSQSATKRKEVISSQESRVPPETMTPQEAERDRVSVVAMEGEGVSGARLTGGGKTETPTVIQYAHLVTTVSTGINIAELFSAAPSSDSDSEFTDPPPAKVRPDTHTLLSSDTVPPSYPPILPTPAAEGQPVHK